MLFSNTLGTALGDFLSDDSGLGFGGGALLIGSLLGLASGLGTLGSSLILATILALAMWRSRC